MKDINNSESDSETNKKRTQDKSVNNLSIAIACGHGTTNNKIVQNTLDYSIFKDKLKAFKEVCTPYLDEVTINNTTKKLNPDEALKHSHKIAKNKAEWFIAGEFDPQTRRTENLKYRSAVVLDLDSYDKDITSLEQAIKQELPKHTYIAYSTASHKPDKPKIRIFLPVSENIATGEYEGITRSFINNLSFKAAIDNASLKPNQFMFFSSIVKITDLPDGMQIDEYKPWMLENDAVLLNPSEFKSKVSQSNTINTGKPDKKVKLSLVKNIEQEKDKSTSLEQETESEEEIQRSLNLTEAEVASSLEEYPAEGLSYDEWLEVAMALHHYYKASDQGIAVFDEWSKKDTAKYNGIDDIKSKWRSFSDIAPQLK